MPNPKVLITTASWEERFLQGIKKTLKADTLVRIIMYFIDDYATWTEDNRQIVRDKARSMGIELREQELKASNPATNWQVMRKTILEVDDNQSCLVDLTTMPRDIIWTTLFLLELKKARINYIYYSPGSYNSEWLSRNAQHPRLIYKLSGISMLGAKTALVAIAGYDLERVRQLRQFYEPSRTIIGLQATAGDADNEARMNVYRERFEGLANVKLFELDAFGADHGRSAIWEEVSDVIESHNIIMSSLGPKLSAVSLYQIQRANPGIGLAYAPSLEFNKQYSSGLGQAFRGEL